MDENEKYFGSVKFYKNLIFIVVIALIAVPTIFAVYFYLQNEESKDINTTLTESLYIANDKITELTKLEEEQEKYILENGINIDTEDGPYYQDLYPDFYAPSELSAKQVLNQTAYITFDDGPSGNTEWILEVLDNYDVKATFFVAHNNTNNIDGLIKEIYDAGHTVAMHTYSHEYNKIYESVESYLDDMYLIFCEIKDATGVAPTIFRFPGGSINGYNQDISQDIITEMLRRGFIPWDWNCSSEDAVGGKKTADQLVNNVLTVSKSYDRPVVLLHDSASKDSSVKALSGIITGLRNQGYDLAPITPSDSPILFDYRN